MPEIKKVKIGEEEFVVRYTVGYMREVNKHVAGYIAEASSKITFTPEQRAEINNLWQRYARVKDNKKKAEEVLAEINNIAFTAQVMGNSSSFATGLISSLDLQYKVLAALLTQRDNKGKITREVTEDEIGYSDAFADAFNNEETREIITDIVATGITKAVEEINKATDMQKKMEDVIQKAQKKVEKKKD